MRLPLLPLPTTVARAVTNAADIATAAIVAATLTLPEPLCLICIATVAADAAIAAASTTTAGAAMLCRPCC